MEFKARGGKMTVLTKRTTVYLEENLHQALQVKAIEDEIVTAAVVKVGHRRDVHR